MFISTTYAAINESSYDTGLLTTDMTFWDLILTVISIFVLIAWILSILFILWGGLLLILSGWKEDKIKPAINTIRYSVLWLIITVVTIFVFPILWGLLNLDVEKYAKPKRIFEKIEQIWNKVFGNSSSSTSSGWSNIDDIDLDEYSTL